MFASTTCNIDGSDMKILGKDDFKAFVNALIRDSGMDIEGVKVKGEKFVFGPLEKRG